jgi:hypothetical protein
MAAAVCERREMLLTNHTLVLVALARDAGLRVRELAEQVGVTERAVETIVGDLERAGYLSRRRNGRRNEYQVHGQQPLTHPLLDGVPVDRLIGGLTADPSPSEQAKPASCEPANPESDVSCASPCVMTILGSTGQPQSEEGTAGRALIYAVLISVLVLGTAASALALTGRAITAGRPLPRSIHPVRRAATAPGPASEGSGHTVPTHRTPMILADSRRTLPQTRPHSGQGRQPAPGRTTIVTSAPVSGPVGTGGGQIGGGGQVGGTTLGVTVGVGQTSVTVSAPLPVKPPVTTPVTLPLPPPVAVKLPGLP